MIYVFVATCATLVVLCSVLASVMVAAMSCLVLCAILASVTVIAAACFVIYLVHFVNSTVMKAFKSGLEAGYLKSVGSDPSSGDAEPFVGVDSIMKSVAESLGACSSLVFSKDTDIGESGNTSKTLEDSIDCVIGGMRSGKIDPESKEVFDLNEL